MSPIAIELATAYVNIVPSTRDIAPGISKALKGSQGAVETEGRSLGSRLASGMGRTLKVGALATGGVIAGVLGTALVKGFARLNAIEQAEAKLRGLGHSAETVTGVMDNALASVKGTAFGLDEAATVAAGVVASGIKPGKELERVLGLTADTATIAGTSMGEMGGIFNKIAASNRVSMQEVNQLSDRGIPIMQMLADQYGVTAGEARTMVEKGEVDFAAFSKAIEDNIGGAALSGGDTVMGAWKNMNASLARIGANLLKGVFPQLQGGIVSLTDFMGGMEDKALDVGVALGGALARGVQQAAGFIRGLTGDVEIMDTSARPKLELLGLGIRALIAAFKDGDVTSGGFVGTMERIGVKLRDVYDTIKGGVRVLSGGTTGLLAKMLDVPQSHVIIRFLQGVHDFVTVTLPAGFNRLKDVIQGAFSVLSGGTTGRLAAALEIPQGHAVIKFLQDFRIKAIAAFGWIRDVALPAVRDLFGAFQSMDKSGIKSGLGEMGGSFKSIGDSLVALMPAFRAFIDQTPSLVDVTKIAAAVLGFFADNVDTVIKYMPAIVAGFVLWKTAQLANMVAGRNSMLGMILQIATTRTLIASNRQLAASYTGTTVSTTANTAATNTGTVAQGRSRLAMIASSVAARAKAAALGVVTVAQRLFNAVLRANPIGLVITAIGLLVAGLVLLYKNNETARKIIDAAWAGIKTAISSVVGWFRDTAWPWMRDALGWIGGKVTWLWKNIYKPYFTFIWDLAKTVFGWVKDRGWPWMRDALQSIGEKATWLWTSHIKPRFDDIKAKASAVFGWIKDTGWPWLRDALQRMGEKASWLYNDHVKPAFNNIRDKIAWAWDKAKDIFTSFKSGLTSLGDKFRSVKDGIADAWGAVVAAVGKPIVATIKWVNDNFLAKVESTLNKIPGVDITLGRITVPAIPTAPRKGDTGARGRIGGLATGGIVGGPWRGPRADNVLGVDDYGVPTARVNPLEMVLSVAGTTKLLRKIGMSGLNLLNRGELPLPGFAQGGRVHDERALSPSTSTKIGADGWFNLPDPIKWLKERIAGLLSGIGSSWPSQGALGVLKAAGSQMVDWARGKLFESDGGSGGGSWQKIVGRIRGAGLNPDIWSTVRREGGRTLTGKISRHGLGLAVDMAPNKAIQDFLWGIRNTLRELYMPDGRGWLLGKPRSAYPGAAKTMANHMGGNAHIHAAYADGGLVKPFVADTGVTLAPGLNLLNNRLGKPEPLARTDQARPERHYHFEASDADQILRKIQAREADEMALLMVSPA